MIHFGAFWTARRTPKTALLEVDVKIQSRTDHCGDPTALRCTYIDYYSLNVHLNHASCGTKNYFRPGAVFSILVLQHDNHVLVQIDIRGDTKASCFHFKRFMWVAKLQQTFNSIKNNILNFAESCWLLEIIEK